MNGLLAAVRLALRAIVRSKLRAALTVLGILIGVAAVVVVVALGTGVRNQILGELSGLGANSIYIFPQSTQASGLKRRDSARLSEADGAAILEESISVAELSPFSSTSMQIVAGEANVATQVMGVTRSYFSILSYTVDEGEGWTEADEQLKTKVCVIGETVRENLFGAGEAVGQYIRIGKHPFRVIGVLTKKGQSPFGEDQDDRLLMPIGSFRSRVVPSAPGKVQMLIAAATSELTVDRAVAQIEGILRQRHEIAPEDEPDFVIRTQAEFRASQEQILGTLTMLLSSIAAVSLLVGGIGVMNIMLVSVTERTREIGIRMAIGASEDDILVQFLVEAITLSVIGGVMGLGVGLGLIQILAGALGWSMTLPPSAIVVAVGTSAAIGIVFGFFPARRAARLDPIQALRHE
ncbi:multidrug ABC transporter substrate-binding protein [Sorangium cellulosum]|uniref:Multidrug ABC transporter substrate-binding protein n=1 Tax=Sorangium cellulosum TaxID=56 RepID=A0A4P2Q8M7_SORCE|nr:ABC transporter permease [Sorangium cellulosum]AUX25885.1 multidrug ABC transporter substrate-binding protein [Sorangium cellulosum]